MSGKDTTQQHKSLTQYYNELLSSLFSYLANPNLTREEEDIHQLRLSIKRLRVFWSLIESISKDKWKKDEHFHVVKSLFDAAGIIREAQINTGYVTGLNDEKITGYIRFLNDEIQQAEKDLSTEVRNFDRNKLEELNKDLSMTINELTTNEINSRSGLLIQQRLRKALKHRKHLDSDHKLHKIRIQLKSMYETLIILNKVNPESEAERIDATSELKSLNDHLGSWHDLSVLVESFKEFRKKLIDRDDRKNFKVQILKFEQDQKREKKKCLKKLDHLIKYKTLEVFEIGH